MNPAQAENVTNVIAKGTQSASAMALANQQGQNISPFDVYDHTVDGLSKRMEEAVNDPKTFLFGDPVQQARVDAAMMPGEWQSSSVDQWIDSAIAQQNAMKSQVAAIGEAEGVLPTIGATFAFLTGVEQMISTMLSVIPFPAFPAVRITDMDVGLPHAHSHPPNITPPNPVPIPLPSTGPLIPIPLFSGASQTLINNMPAARCGDMGLSIWCGGYFPMYEVFLGSSNVWIEGARAARVMIDITKHCIFTTPRPSDPPLGPMIGMTTTSSTNVLIGGVPMPSLLGMAMGAAFKGLGKLLGKGAKVFGRVTAPLRKKLGARLPSGFLKCKVLRAEPVNVVTGAVVVDQQDYSIPGRIPIEWNRHYNSSSNHMGVCGYGWETPADIRLEIDDEGVVILHRGSDGVAIFNALPNDNETVMEPINGGVLNRRQNHLVVQIKDGMLYYFEIPKSPTNEIAIDSIADLHGNSLRFIRDEHGLKQIVESAGRRIDVTSRNGLILAMQLYHPDEKNLRPLIRYEYDPETSDLLAVYDALDHPYRFKYHNHCLTQHTDRNGLSFYYQYDEYSIQGRCVHTWGDGGLYDYHLVFNPLKGETLITNSLGHTSSVEYTDDFLIFKETDPLNGVTLYEYDEIGRTSAVIDPANKRTEYYYDVRGNLVKVVRPDSAAIVNIYDENNGLAATIDPNGKIWQFENEKGLLKKRITPRGAEWHYDYNGYGDLMAVTNPTAAKTVFQRDRFGNVVGLTDPLGHASHFVYDVVGNLTINVDPLGQKTSYLYDTKNRMIRVTYPSGSHIQIDYDNEDNLIKYKNQNGHITHLKYSGLGELAIRIKPDGTKVRYRYDTEEQLIAVINERDEIYQLNRDALGRITQEIDYWSQTTDYTFDSAGNVIQIPDPLNHVTNIVYDDLGRILEKKYCDGKKDNFAYDANGNLTLVDNETITIIREYDDDGNMVCEKQGDFKVENTYDLLGRRIKRTSGHGNILELLYDATDSVSGMILNGQPLLNAKRDALGRIYEETLSNKLKRTMAYDQNGYLIHQKLSYGETIAVRNYEYDLVGNLTKRTDVKKGIYILGYDPVDQVSQQIDPLGNLYQLNHDPTGDLLRAVSNPEGLSSGSVRAAEYDDIRYEYDAAGNLLLHKHTNSETKFFWDGGNRLSSVINEKGQKIVFGYDGLGRRFYKTVNNESVQFLWDQDILLSDQNSTDEKYREFIFYEETFEPFAFIKNDTFFYFENDHIGLPHSIVDTNGTILWSVNYGVNGEVVDTYHSLINNPIRFQGQYYDEEIKLCYNRYRYYNPKTKSFVSIDPLRLEGGINLYSYAANVWGWIDPYGLLCKWLRRWFQHHTAAGRLPRFSGRSRRYVESHLNAAGFTRDPANPTHWWHPDGSRVRVDPPHVPSRGPSRGGYRGDIEPHVHKEWQDPSGASASPGSYGVGPDRYHTLDDYGRLNDDPNRTHIIIRD